jgi:hypothetical protein
MARKRVALAVLAAAALAGLMTVGTWASLTTNGASMMGVRGSGAGMMNRSDVAGRAGMMDGGMMGDTRMGAVVAGDGVRVRSLDAGRQRAQRFADRWGLRVGEVMQFDNGFYAELLTTDGTRATEVLVDPADGSVRLEYGPAMMWNISYGMHAGSVSGSATVSTAEATKLAQAWLDAQRPGLTAGEPELFPGYYTLHTMRDGKVAGMLSVNAFTGAVWYHVWHGTYIAMSEG